MEAERVLPLGSCRRLVQHLLNLLDEIGRMNGLGEDFKRLPTTLKIPINILARRSLTAHEQDSTPALVTHLHSVFKPNCARHLHVQ